MVFEMMINPRTAEKAPWKMFPIGIIYTSLAIILSLWLFKNQASLVMVFFTVMACFYLVIEVIKDEEHKDADSVKEVLLLKEHSRVLAFFMFLFLGFIVAFSLWNLLLPEDLSGVVFKTQMQTIQALNAPTGNANTDVTGHALTLGDYFWRILFNNLKVMTFCLLFSLFYGAGAIFILAWNGSVIATAISTFAREAIGMHPFAAYSLGLTRYMTHGFFEILAYFIAGLAGGIISIAIINHDIGTPRYKKILWDSVDLIVIAVVVLVIAAGIEVFITPYMYN